MADFNELVDMLCKTVTLNERAIPITLWNHSAEMAQQIIVAVVEQLAREGVVVQTVQVDPSLAMKLGLQEGSLIAKDAPAILALQDGLGRQVIFERKAATELN